MAGDTHSFFDNFSQRWMLADPAMKKLQSLAAFNKRNRLMGSLHSIDALEIQKQDMLAKTGHKPNTKMSGKKEQLLNSVPAGGTCYPKSLLPVKLADEFHPP